MKNARFWIYMNGGPVKITLKPDQTLEHFQGGRCEEGWSSETTSWEYEDGVVRQERCSDGRDCDGRLTTYGEIVCPLDSLSAGNVPYTDGDEPTTWAGVIWPDWQKESSYQRDEYAEAAGY